jgi:hypothetical protein
MENHPQGPATKTPNESGMSSTLHLDEPLAPLGDLEGLTALEDQEDPQMFPPLTSSLFNPPTT